MNPGLISALHGAFQTGADFERIRVGLRAPIRPTGLKYNLMVPVHGHA
jgi:hypothetical protein